MSEILVEPSSQREDNRIWVWNYGDPVHAVCQIQLIDQSTGRTYLEIPQNYYARFMIKSDLREGKSILEKNFNFDGRGVFIVDLTTEEVLQLKPEAHYYVGMALYDEFGNFIRTLVSFLPLRIARSVFKDQLF